MLPWPLLDQLRGFADLSGGLVSGLVYASAEDRCIGVEAAQRLRKPHSPAAGAPIPSRKPRSLARKLAGLIARPRGLRWQGKRRRAPGSRLRGPSSELRAQGSQSGHKAKSLAGASLRASVAELLALRSERGAAIARFRALRSRLRARRLASWGLTASLQMRDAGR
jgi:hypothetical protein